MAPKRPISFALPAAVLASTFMAGCTLPAANYAPSVENAEYLKKASVAPAKVGAFVTKPGMANPDAIAVRANGMYSPVGQNYADYLSAALRAELDLAKLYDPVSPIEVSGTLLHNNINTAGISTNDGQLEAQFIVRRNAEVRYDKVKKTSRAWDGSFAGAVAIPAAANNYPLMVRQLIGELFADPDFIRAVQQR